MPRNTGLALAICVLLGAVAIAAPARAWEDDVHFGLTEWLARQAGYDEPIARLLAERDVGVDEGVLDATTLVFWYACVSRDVTASELVRDHHFPSGAGPGPPATRTVTPGDKWALRAARTEIERGARSEDERQDNLRRFGTALHALQDSWSHQGEPGIPFACNQDLAWGHPSARGGWIRHRADLTRQWPEDTVATARATWSALAAFAEVKPWVLARPPAGRSEVRERLQAIWPRLAHDLESFAAARTKTEKLRWFVDHGFTEASILAHVTGLSLPDGERPLSRMNIPMAAALAPGAPVVLGSIPVPAGAAAFLRDFWNKWVSSRGLPAMASIATTFVAARELTANLAAKGRPDDVAATALAIWRIADHGQVERLGHVPPIPGSPAESELQLLLKDPASFTVADGITYAMRPLGAKGPALVLLSAGGNRYAAMGRFRNAPHDVVIAIAEQIGGAWKITELRSVVEH
jgi:hypothetical protein